MCADFLRDNLHLYIINDPCFPEDPKQAILNAFELADKHFLETVEKHTRGALIDRSGSCAMITLIIDHTCFLVNLGDSRALMSCGHGRFIASLSNDHNPTNQDEVRRVIEAGGSIQM
jgi:protein phosphatase 2C family protein 2/3